MAQHIRTLANNMFREDIKQPYRLTPFIVTFCSTSVSSIDMENFIEMGLRIIRFKITNLTRSDRIMLLAKFKQAMKLFCEKFDVPSWPIAICIDLPNACIKTGYFGAIKLQDSNNRRVNFEENSIVELTCDPKLWNKCSRNRLFMDDPYSFKMITPGKEITVGCGKVILNCIEVLNEQTIKCKTIQGGTLGDVEFVCIRGITHLKPPLSRYDLSMIEFAKEFKLNIIIMNFVRRRKTLDKVKELFKNSPMPYIVSTICEQEGLDNIDAIIEASDGIILAREFMAYEIVNKYQMIGIQNQLSAKCRQRGKPFFVSGNVLEDSLSKGILLDRDLTDITNAALDGTGFVLRHLENPANILIAMNVLHSVSKSVESLQREQSFWRVLDEIRMPVNAAEACCLACALAAKQSNSRVILVPTVTGSTARILSHIAPEVIILTISSNSFVARKLQLLRGIIPLIYNEQSKLDFEDDMNSRVAYAINYCVKYNILKYLETYVLLRRTSVYSAFADHLSVRTVTSQTSSAWSCAN
ncbi:pyruvate kinase-like [Battus philenor]|uniref:pyruvate kinase-like n=1 Tax=Battus philenor TaxID=42288 RepID=UPI0035CEC655